MLSFREVIARHKRGDLQQTMAGCREILRREPEHFEALSLLSVVEFETGNVQVALALANRLVELCPDKPAYFSNRAKILAALGASDQSIDAYLVLIKDNPDNGALRLQLAELYARQERFDLAVEQAEVAATLLPESAQPRLRLATLLRQAGRPQAALQQLEKAQTLDPRSSKIQRERADLLNLLGRAEESRQIYQALLAESPRDAGLQTALGQVLAVLGETEQALDCHRRALALDPALQLNYYSIAQLQRYRELTPDIAEMQSLLESTGTGEENQVYLAFALGKVFKDLKDYDASFRYYARANTLHRRHNPELGGRPGVILSQVQCCIDAYSRSAEPPAPPGADPGLPKPLFLVGMPRSGSTLAEQILSMHSNVDAAGEYDYLSRSLERWGQRAGEASPEKLQRAFIRAGVTARQEVRDSYLRQLDFHRGDGSFVTDKMLYNFIHIGEILSMLPDAPIIECVRDPLDGGWSIFSTPFSDHHAYSNDLADIGRVYRAYRAIMEFWHQRFPGRIYSLRYETLIADPEPAIRQLLQFCGLPFEQACLSPASNPRPVRTASIAQVREPIYSSSVGIWKRYTRHLQPLVEALGDAAEIESV